MLPHRICHRRLRGLLSQRSSVPQGNGGAFVLPEGFPDIFHRDAGRLSDLNLPVVGRAIPKNDEVMLYGDGLPISLTRMCFMPSSMLLIRKWMEPKARANITSPLEQAARRPLFSVHVLKHVGGHGVNPCPDAVIFAVPLS